ncbi:F-box domain-containing protein [Favolaschia claudopus]|uniref:F-box domain-containing protein n=1 Tax=Favolaschia claudopus TaxID=2862362 RepID=A0AAW0DV50_9AGAR
MLNTPEADRKQIADVDAQQEDLRPGPGSEDRLAELRSHRAAAQARIDAYKYPVLTLPTEITSEIFLQFLPAYPLCPNTTGLHSPTLLTHVCSQWRNIALSTPKLWRAIDLLSQEECEGIDHIRDAWLSRSGCCPLSLDILVDEYGESSLPALIAHRTRIEYLTITGPTSDAIPHLSIFDSSMPLLRHLELTLWEPLTQITLEKAPLLRSVFLSQNACANVRLPWQHLTSLRLYWCFPEEILAILPQTPNLETCNLCVYIRDPHITLPQFSLLRLDTLILDTELDPRSPLDDRIIRSLITPALRHLEISERSLGDNPLDTLSSFLSNSTCKLDRLHIMYDGGGLSIPLERYHLLVPTISSILASKIGAETSILAA